MVESLTAAIGRLLGSPAFKFFLICGLILVLTIPLLLVWGLIGEREQRAEGVRQSVAQEWGGSQYIDGPLLIVPYTVKRVTGEGDKRVEEMVEQRAVFLPKSLKISGKATTKVLHRSIYDVAVYTSFLDFEGSFAAPDISEVVADVQAVRWRDAVLAVAVSDVSGLKEAASLSIDGGDDAAVRAEHRRAGDARRRHSCAAGVGSRSCSRRPVPPDVRPPSAINGFDFKFQLTLERIVRAHICACGAADDRRPDVRLARSELHGRLPAQRPRAQPGVVRRPLADPASGPQRSAIMEPRRSGAGTHVPLRFGVRFIVPVDFYQLVSRAAKYAMMFLATAFMAVFLLGDQLVAAGAPGAIPLRRTHHDLLLRAAAIARRADRLPEGLSHRRGGDRRSAIAIRGARAGERYQGARHGRRVLRAVRPSVSDPAAGGLRAASPAPSPAS